MRVTSKRLEQLERHLGKSENRWVPWENKPSPEIEQQLEELKVIRDSQPDPNVREGSIMDMLGKELGH